MQGDLAAPSAMTTLTDSAVVLAVVSAFLSPEAAWRAAQTEEDYCHRRWS
jgi:chaperone required for assembly of F1-ATPase